MNKTSQKLSIYLILILFSLFSNTSQVKPDFVVIFRCLDCSCNMHLDSYYLIGSSLVCNNNYNPQNTIETQAKEMVSFIIDEKNKLLETKKDKKNIKVDFFGFSIGGVTARYIIQYHFEELEKEGIIINNLVTFGSPHLGTFKAADSKILNFLIGGLHNLLKPIANSVSGASEVFLKESNDKYYGNSFLRRINGVVKEDGYLLKPDHIKQNFLKNFRKLNHIYLLRYTEDTVVNPSFSAWFLYDKDIFGESKVDLNEDHKQFINSKVITMDDLIDYNIEENVDERLNLFFEDNIGINELFYSKKLTLLNNKSNHLYEDFDFIFSLKRLLNY